MNSVLEIEELSYSEINYLIDGFKIWYKKNNSESDENVLRNNAEDMFQSCDTELFKLKDNNSIIGVFFIVDIKDAIEIGGGLLGTSNAYKNTYFVFDFCVNKALNYKKKFIYLNVINNHYKHEALLKYYYKYGFNLSKIDNNSTKLFLSLPHC
jgi:hypothetical protein